MKMPIFPIELFTSIFEVKKYLNISTNIQKCRHHLLQFLHSTNAFCTFRICEDLGISMSRTV